MTRNVTTRPDPGDSRTTVVEVDGEVAGGFTSLDEDSRYFAAHFIYREPYVHGFYPDGIQYANAQSAIDSIVEQFSKPGK